MSTGSGTIGSGTDLERGRETNVSDKTGTEELELVFDPTTKAALDKALASDEYSKTAAVADAKAAADYAMTQVLQAGIPQVSGAAKGAGGYNASTAEMLTGDVAARAGAASSQVMLDTIAKYSAAQSAGISARTGAVSATTGRRATTAETAAEEKKTQNRTDRIATSATGGTVICTQLFLDGYLTKEVYAADNRYVRNHFSYYTAKGYRFWAVPFVQLMRRNTVAYAVGKYVGMRWSKHCAAYYLKTECHNLVGACMSAVVAPICYLIGLVVPETDFRKLWEESPYHGN